MSEFTGPSAHYLRQQTAIALAALAPLQKLGPDVERQGLAAVIVECERRLDLLPKGETQAINAADVGELKAVL